MSGTSIEQNPEAGPRVPRTRLDRIAEWYRASPVGTWGVVVINALFQTAGIGHASSLGMSTLALKCVLSVMTSLSLIWRRRWPLVVVIINNMALMMKMIKTGSAEFLLPLLVAIYTLIAIASIRQRLPVLGLEGISLALAALDLALERRHAFAQLAGCFAHRKGALALLLAAPALRVRLQACDLEVALGDLPLEGCLGAGPCLREGGLLLAAPALCVRLQACDLEVALGDLPLEGCLGAGPRLREGGLLLAFHKFTTLMDLALELARSYLAQDLLVVRALELEAGMTVRTFDGCHLWPPWCWVMLGV